MVLAIVTVPQKFLVLGLEKSEVDWLVPGGLFNLFREETKDWLVWSRARET